MNEIINILLTLLLFIVFFSVLAFFPKKKDSEQLGSCKCGGKCGCNNDD